MQRAIPGLAHTSAHNNFMKGTYFTLLKLGQQDRVGLLSDLTADLITCANTHPC